MPQGLKHDTQIWKLAKDLRLKGQRDPVTEIVAYCEGRVGALLKQYPCDSLSELVNNVAADLDTIFREIRSDEELLKVRDHFLKKGEKEFALLESELEPEVFAVTFRRVRRKKGEREFLSVIDCRGEKSFRSYFSKWHELAHLLTLTDQMRLKFCRTHSSRTKKDPEEALMEVIAGHVGFLPEMVRRHAQGPISFAKIAEMRELLCPEASVQASTIGFAKSWPAPCVLIEAGLEYKKSEQAKLNQRGFDFLPAPTPELRILHVNSNEAAQHVGKLLHPNMRIPRDSVIHRVFTDELSPATDVLENLDCWETKSAGHLPQVPLRVHAQKSGSYVQVLLVPESEG